MCKKLCDNIAVPKRDKEGYNPCYKYDYICMTICHNTNYVTANPDVTVDETTWGLGGYGEKVAVVVEASSRLNR